MNRVLSDYLRDERGAVTIDFVVTFLPVLVFVVTVCEIAIAYYFTSAAQKSAQLAARLAASRPPVHTGVPTENVLNPTFGDVGDSCYHPAGDPCVDPGVSWVCDGDGSPFPAECDEAALGAIVTEVQRLYPTLQIDDVAIGYVYRRLGTAGGAFVPEVQVEVRPQTPPVNFISLMGFIGMRPATASVLGEDLG